MLTVFKVTVLIERREGKRRGQIEDREADSDESKGWGGDDIYGFVLFLGLSALSPRRGESCECAVSRFRCLPRVFVLLVVCILRFVGVDTPSAPRRVSSCSYVTGVPVTTTV